MSKKPVLLCIMDGFGWTPNETYGNAVVAAKKPFLDSLMAKYPMTTIEASGMAVGLPDGQMGNSEVGLLNIGAGRIVFQELSRINNAIKDGSINENPVFVKAMDDVKAEGKTRAITIPAMPLGAVAEETDPRENQIPILGNVAAGAPILAEACIEDYLPFDTQGMSGEHFALRVRGEDTVLPISRDRVRELRRRLSI